MAFSTGTAANWAALASAMNTFMTVTLGFTSTYTNGNAFTGGGGDAHTWELDGMHWNFDYNPTADRIGCWMSTGNDGTGTTFGDHTGTARGSSANEDIECARMTKQDFASSVTYFFFGDESGGGTYDYFHMVISNSVGKYMHMCLGYIDPVWSAAKPFGAYLTSTQFSSNGVVSYSQFPYHSMNTLGFSQLHYPYDATPVGAQTDIQYTGQANKIADTFCPTIGLNEQAGVQTTPLFHMGRAGAQLVSGRSIISPNPAIVSDAQAETSVARCILAGRYVDVGATSMQGFAAEDEFTVGSDTWKIFPLHSKGSETVSNPWSDLGDLDLGTLTSGLRGWAYRKF